MARGEGLVIRLVVALPVEAKPLIAHFQLERAGEARGFEIYEKEGISLVVSGIGKTAAAAATAYLQAWTGNQPNAAWINVGMAGHRDLLLGEGILGDRITDRATGEAWYPPPVIEAPCPRAPLMTVDRVEEAFAEEWVFEMEAAGFYPSACRFASAELVQCYKIISDNASVPPRWLSRRQVDELIEARLPEIDAVVQETARLADELAASSKEPLEMQTLLNRWHFTSTERHRLHRLLQRWQVLAPDRDLLDSELARRKTGKDVLGLIQARIESLPVRLL
jgi:hypothetical protein